MKRQPSSHFFASITILVWASGFALTKIALGFFSSNSIGFLRYAISTILLLPIIIYKTLSLPALRDIPLFFASGATGFFLYMITFNKGMETLSSATSSILIATAPILTALLAFFLFKERLSLSGWIAVAIEFAGVFVLMLWNGVLSISIGALWMMAAALLISSYNLLQRRLTRTYSPLQTTAYSIFAGTILLLCFLPETLPQLIQAPFIPLVAVILLGVFPSTVGYVCWSKALSIAKKTSTVTNYMFLTPFFSTLLGFLLILEVPGISTIIGGCIILAGLALFRISEKRNMLEK